MHLTPPPKLVEKAVAKNISTVDKHIHNYLFTASNVKHHLNIFREKIVKLSKYELIPVIFMNVYIQDTVEFYQKYKITF